jgi:hypothetical protein
MLIAGATARPLIAGGRVGVTAAGPTHAGVVTRAEVMAIAAAAFLGLGGATAGVTAAEDRTAMTGLGLAAEDEAATEGLRSLTVQFGCAPKISS